MELSREYKDWTPSVRRPDPRSTRPQDLASQKRTKDFARPGTSWDSRLRETPDFVGFKTSRDPGLHGVQDFAGHRTSWDLGLYRKQKLFTPRTRILFCGVLQENTNFPDQFKTMDTTWYKVSK